MNLRVVIASASLALAPICIAAEEPFAKPLAELMGADTFREAGLDTLSESQLATLQGWLRSHAGTMVAGAAEAAAKAEVKRQAEKQGIQIFDTPTEDRFESRIVGELDGIRGRGQTFRLENGQVWRFVDSQTSRTFLRNPAVRLRASAIGQSYLITIRGISTDLRVERVK